MKDSTVTISDFQVEIVKGDVKVLVRYMRNGLSVSMHSNTAPVNILFGELEVTDEMTQEKLDADPYLHSAGRRKTYV